MAEVEKIKTAFERQTKAVKLRPSMGQGTAITKVRMRDGLTCEIEDGNWKLTADMSEKWGGEGRGPNPGVLGRGAFGSCLVMSYAMWAARLDVPISNIEVEVQADYDTRGICALDEVSAGYREIRYVVSLESAAEKEEVLRVLDEAEAHSPYYDVFGKAQTLRRDVQIRTAKE